MSLVFPGTSLGDCFPCTISQHSPGTQDNQWQRPDERVWPIFYWHNRLQIIQFRHLTTKASMSAAKAHHANSYSILLERQVDTTRVDTVRMMTWRLVARLRSLKYVMTFAVSWKGLCNNSFETLHPCTATALIHTTGHKIHQDTSSHL